MTVSIIDLVCSQAPQDVCYGKLYETKNKKHTHMAKLKKGKALMGELPNFQQNATNPTGLVIANSSTSC